MKGEEKAPEEGTLFLVGTPIGNLEDITLRALRVLKEVQWIAAEDTRRSRILLDRYGIQKPLLSVHRFNEARQIPKILDLLKSGQTIALITDAGMPCFCDPGERVAQACRREGIRVEGIPGPSAILQALIQSGFPTTPFYFGGYLPRRPGARRREWAEASARVFTSVYFESPHRLVASLEDACKVATDLQLCIARELTKMFEELRWGQPGELVEWYKTKGVKGEVCIVVRGRVEGKGKANAGGIGGSH
ncbi:16S rRNA (cytidine(1402)-2'-O)-methyltransferase [Candidatus Methylacidithermus pantelleriae]|uniref:Ribosomal RNA small subunit methyltransferase I n=1 Tax=Candidatus Methylacidithermus pantelleriae TaxID=2744239 RepID=A0A8J2FR63_9BACT|nr:16S rRNA (cytidine(1402)-2'-O)-methyltransferase [Candidatus Methylacidithermus pantelleriae]CAF0688854.1 Ribosomal RNA small subunit methyltransferase I [Candidatus Methylacidithermus pantelleriae]